jgi:hypothetical protein
MSLCQFGNGMFGSGPTGFVLASHGYHLHGRRGRGFDAARWDVLRFVQERHRSARCDLFRYGESWNHHRVGTEADRRGRGGMLRFGVSFARTVKSPQAKSVFRSSDQGVARSVVARIGVFRLSTTPVQARFPIDAGGVGCIAVCLIGAASFWAVLVSSVHDMARIVALWKPSSCRHGAGSTPAAWDVFRSGTSWLV